MLLIVVVLICASTAMLSYKRAKLDVITENLTAIYRPALWFSCAMSAVYLPLVILNIGFIVGYNISPTLWKIRIWITIAAMAVNILAACRICVLSSGLIKRAAIWFAGACSISLISLLLTKLPSYENSFFAYVAIINPYFDFEGSPFLYIFIEFLGLLTSIGLLTGFLMARPRITRLWPAIAGCALLVATGLYNTYSLISYRETDHTINSILSVVIAILITVSLWWSLPEIKNGGVKIEKPSRHHRFNPQKVTKGVKMAEKRFSRPLHKDTAINEATINQLMGQTDDQLRQVVDHPELYSNQGYVTEAQKILNKRAAWTLINNKSDEELINIAIDSTHIYADDMRDAASMELYSRDSHLLRDALTRADNALLNEIKTHPENFYDGYVMMARKIDNERSAVK